MKKKVSIGLLGAVAAVVCTIAICAIFSHKPAEIAKKSPSAKVSATPIRGKSASNAAAIRRGKRRSIAEIKVSESTKPDFKLDSDEEAKLTELQKKLLADIIAACDENDANRLIKIVQKMQASSEWPDGIPQAIKEAAIDALKWFGAECLPELVGFLGESTQEAIEAVADAFEDAIFDADGDRQIAKILRTASITITDFDSIESIMMHISELRPSEQAAYIKYVLQNGTPAAKAAVQEEAKFIIDTETDVTEAMVDKWISNPENQDDEDAEEMYGPSRD